MTPIAVRAKTQVARPLKVLVPLIKQELEAGHHAGQEHYRRAGEMLLEAKEQIPYGSWGRWVSKHFSLSERTAREYMMWARDYAARSGGGAAEVSYRSLREVTGATERHRQRREADRPFREAARNLDAELFARERQTQDDEVRLHRDLALEFVTIGYRALATRLHPDRGGSKDAMVRLNRIRDVFKTVAETRRFV